MLEIGRSASNAHVFGRMIENTETALEREGAVLEQYARSENPRLAATASFQGLNNATDERRVPVGITAMVIS